MRTRRRMVGILTLLLGGIATACESPGKDERSTSSPSGQYALHVRGAGDWPTSLGRYRTVGAELAGPTFRAALPLYAGDSMDSSFDARYADPAWLSDHVVKWPSRAEAGEQSTISVENRSTRMLPSIRVSYADLIVLFRLQAGEVVSVPTKNWWVTEYPEVQVDAYELDGKTIASGQARTDATAWKGNSALIKIVLSDASEISVSIEKR